MCAKSDKEKELEQEIEHLKGVIQSLQQERNFKELKTVSVPNEISGPFDAAQKTVGSYFEKMVMNPEEGTIEINDQRYVLLRASSLSVDFLKAIQNLYSDRPKDEAFQIGRNFLFDIAHLVGMEDAKNFHKTMNLTDPVSKLAAGPVHFAYSGWAFVDILPESKPAPDDSYYLKYHHPFSFEADAWIKGNKNSKRPVCIMNAGYSSGWCEESYGVPLTAVEISCKAKGDDNCTFIMAPPHKIHEYLEKEVLDLETSNIKVPSFFERKNVEEKLKASIREKDVLLQEIHHRVKNNLQVISSLLNLQSGFLTDENYKEKFRESIDRIQAMALIHELLYSSHNFEELDFGSYLERMLATMRVSYNLDSKGISLNSNVSTDAQELSIDTAIPAALILNELVSNAIKYAFPSNRKGSIAIDIRSSEEETLLIVRDDGIGLPNGFNPSHSGGLGFELIHALTEQLDGTLEFASGEGTEIRIRY